MTNSKRLSSRHKSQLSPKVKASQSINNRQISLIQRKKRRTRRNRYIKNTICYYCNKAGHIAPECNTRKRENNSRNPQNRNWWRSPKKDDQNTHYSRQYNNNQANFSPPVNRSNANYDNRRSQSNDEGRRSQPNDDGRPQWNRSQPNNNYNNRSRSNDNARPFPQYNNKQYNRDFDNSSRNKTENYKPNDRNVRIMREGEIDWNDIVPVGEDVCGLGN